MVRPRKKEKLKPTNLTLNPRTKREASDFAFENNESLSQVVNRLLENFVAEEQAKYGGPKLSPAATKVAGEQAS